MEYLLATGNLVSRSGLGLMQVRIDGRLSDHIGDNNRSVNKVIP